MPEPTRTVSLAEAHAHCAAVVRASDSSFASAFWMFPAERRRALHAIYAFCRLADDIADDPEHPRRSRRDPGALARRSCVDAYRRKVHRHPVGRRAGRCRRIVSDCPRRFFDELLDGVEIRSRRPW